MSLKIISLLLMINNGDLLIFRRNGYGFFILSFFTLNLDNFYGVYNNGYLEYYDWKMKLKKIKFKSINKEEFYHYKPVGNIKLSKIRNCIFFNYNYINNNFRIVKQYNFRKKQNYLYFIATLIPFLFFNYTTIFKYFLDHIFFYLYFIFSDILFNFISSFVIGKRFVGFVFFFSIIKYLCNINSWKFLGTYYPNGISIIYYWIFLIRLASWFNNDIFGSKNPTTMRPYDTSLWEAFFTALIPGLLVESYDNTYMFVYYYFYLYSIARFIIEFFKKKYHQAKFNLSIGQIDCIYLFFQNYLFFNDYNNYLLILTILFYDINLRIYSKKILFIDNTNFKLNLVSPVKNTGFSLSIMKNYSFYLKLVINLISMIISYYLNFNLFLLSLLNFLERLLFGHVTDYIQIKIFKLSFICNISDIIIFFLMFI